MNRKARIKKNRFPLFALGISVAGFVTFYLIPFVVSSVYAFTKNPIQREFVGFKNFIDIFQNRFFLLGLKNTAFFMLFAIPLGMCLSLLLSLALKRLSGASNLFSVLFLIPLVVPSAAVVDFWRGLFEGSSIMSGDGAIWLTVAIYVWKNLGYNTVLFLAGLNAIPEEYYQCAAVFGANAWQRFRQVTFVYLTPAFFLTFIMSFVNSFKIFREVYLLWHDYPPESVYLLQHFVNSTLTSMRYQKLVSGVYVLTAVIVLIVAISFYFERRFYKKLSA